MDIVILTSHANFDYAKEAITLQINDYLLKPVNIQSLIKAIQTSRDKKMAESDSARKQTLVSLRAMMLYDIPFSDLLLDTALLRDLFPYAYISVVVLEPGAGLKLPDPEVYQDIFLDFYDVCYPMIFVDRREVVFICNHAIFSVKTKALKERLIERLHSSDFALGTSISSSSCETLHQLYMNSVWVTFCFRQPQQVVGGHAVILCQLDKGIVADVLEVVRFVAAQRGLGKPGLLRKLFQRQATLHTQVF